MSTLLLRLAGPMQSWGSGDRFTVRFTGREPTKSGVIGLVCAALGRPRSESVDDLARLVMGVRVEHEGAVMRDYHTTGGVHRKGEKYRFLRPDGSPVDHPVLSYRYFLADADFLVGLEGDDDGQLAQIEGALKSPRWQLALGRKAFVPGLPVYLPGGGLRPGLDLLEALAGEEWPMPGAHRERRRAGRASIGVRIVREVGPGETNDVRMDQPYGAAFQDRTFGPRWVTLVPARAVAGATPSTTESPIIIPLRSEQDVPLTASA